MSRPHPMLLVPVARSLLWLVVIVSFFLTFTCVHATSEYPNPTPAGKSWAPCAFAVTQISAEGNGSTYGSCLTCSPTSFTCPPKCQSLIDALYKQCDAVFAPQDLYFDPANTLNGYFNDHMDVLRVQAARCGCSGAVGRNLHYAAARSALMAMSTTLWLLM